MKVAAIQKIYIFPSKSGDQTGTFYLHLLTAFREIEVFFFSFTVVSIQVFTEPIGKDYNCFVKNQTTIHIN